MHASAQGNRATKQHLQLNICNSLSPRLYMPVPSTRTAV
jgi:hypothetical protein